MRAPVAKNDRSFTHHDDIIQVQVAFGCTRNPLPYRKALLATHVT
jgi:hypothetical protein